MGGRKGTAEPYDFAVTARRVVEQAIGEQLTGDPLLEKAVTGRISVARSGAGHEGGKQRARKLTPEQRSEIARIAAEARWKKR